MFTTEADEMAILGLALTDPDKLSEISEGLQDKYFTSEPRRAICKAVKALIVSGGSVDMVSVSERLGDRQITAEAMSMVASVDYITPPEIILFRLHDRWAREQIKIQGYKIASRADDPSLTLPELCEGMEDIKSETATTRQTVFTMREMLKSVAMKLDEVRTGKSWGIKTGFEPFDFAFKGFDRGDCHIISARTGNGKTSFAIDMMVHSELKIYFASTEMDQNQIALKMAANLTGLDSSRLREKAYLDQNWALLREGLVRIDKLPILVDANGSQKASGIRIGAKRAKRLLGGLDAIVVDHLQFLRPENPRDGRPEQISESSKILKTSAKDLDVATFVLSQLNRGVEDRGSVDPPKQRDLKGSGAIEEDAATITFLHYPAKYDDTKNPKYPKNLLQLIASKSRHSEGEQFIDLYWQKECSRFRRFEQADWDSFTQKNFIPRGK